MTRYRLTARQFEALRAARDKGGAIYGKGRKSSMGGSYRRMCERLAKRGLVEDWAPFPITDQGRAVLTEWLSARSYLSGEKPAQRELGV